MPAGASAKTRRADKWIDEQDARIHYFLRPRARRVSIKMDMAKRHIAVSVPTSPRNLKQAQNFVRKKWDWIQIQLETLPPAQPFVDGGHILFQGTLYRLVCPDARGRGRIDEGTKEIHVPAPQGSFEGRTKRFLIRTARKALEERTSVHADALAEPVMKISVRDTSSRWGSCLQKTGPAHQQNGGQISYSWRLICAPPFVLDYVAAHECAHLIHANHGANFWALCDELVDTVKPAKHWLTQNGALLHAVGAPV